MTNKALREHAPKSFYELDMIARLGDGLSGFGRVQIETTLSYSNCSFPVYSFQFGSSDMTAPVLIFTGGVHGLERIGTRILISFLTTLAQQLRWDEVLMESLSKCRLLFYPLVNPGGMYWNKRSNPSGIDLMRNAPVEVDHVPRFSLVAGHRISSWLPWYRGLEGVLQPEADALCRFIQRETSQARVAVSLDIHSGFGTVDRLWFPYAKTKSPFPRVAELYKLISLLDRTHPHHVYFIEPQSKQYTTSGDIWDYLFDEHSSLGRDSTYLPLSLELGSWAWVKKNPRQLLNVLGAFNPILPHRRKRIMRRHVTLFDFLMRATISYRHWAELVPEERLRLGALARDLWYG